MVLEGVRGSGIEGDIAIDDVSIEEGKCQDPPPNSSKYTMCYQRMDKLEQSADTCVSFFRSQVFGSSHIKPYMAVVSRAAPGPGRPPEVTAFLRGPIQFRSDRPLPRGILAGRRVCKQQPKIHPVCESVLKILDPEGFH